jgi:hypothetical protein
MSTLSSLIWGSSLMVNDFYRSVRPQAMAREEILVSRITRFSRYYRRFPGTARFAREWKDRALKRRMEVRRNPFLDNVPIQLLSIGDLNIVSLPGEVFCEIGLELQARTPNIWAIGYGNGTIGYIPTRSAYRRPAELRVLLCPAISDAVSVHPRRDRKDHPPKKQRAPEGAPPLTCVLAPSRQVFSGWSLRRGCPILEPHT